MVRMILSKHAKFLLVGFSTFRDMTSQIFPLQNGTTHRDLIFTRWNRAKLEKNHFENIFPGTNLYSLCISMVLKRNKNSYVEFLEPSHFKNNCSNPSLPPSPPDELILLKIAKMCLTDKKKVNKFRGARESRFRVMVNNLMVGANPPTSPPPPPPSRLYG